MIAGTELHIDSEFSSLIPPTTPAELGQLEASILAEGCRDRLVVWGPEGILLDGHNRYRLCRQHNISFDVREISLPDRDAAKVWIIKNQFGRRNLTPYQRAELALKLEPLMTVRASELMQEAGMERQSAIRAIEQRLRNPDLPSMDQMTLESRLGALKGLERSETRRAVQWTYVVRAGNKAKVGFSEDPEDRLRQIRTSNPDAEIIAILPGGRDLESELHSRHAESRLSGEWFRWTPELNADIERLGGIAQMGKPTTTPYHVHRELSKLSGLGKNSIAKAKLIADKAPEEVKEQLRQGETSINAAYKEVRRQERRSGVTTGKAGTPTGKYRVIYADPPWEYGNSGLTEYGHAESHYPTMPLGDLCAMPVKEWAEEDAVLFLWVTSPMLESAFAIIKAWGFKYKTSFVWDKVKHNFGHYNSVRHELLMVCTRGSCTPDTPKLYDSVQVIERTDRHSEKPEAFRTIIEALYTRGPKLELFARAEHAGWTVHGNQL